MAKRLAKTALLCALSLIAFTIENLFPPLFIPGARLGVGNVFVILCLIYYGYGSALTVLTAKCILSAIFQGNVFSAVYALSAGAVSITVTYVLLRFAGEKVSLTSVSALSACLHNLVQLAVFMLITESFGTFAYAPYLALVGCVSGVFTGFLCGLTVKRDFRFFRDDGINAETKQ